MNRGNRPRLSRVSGSSFASRLFTRAGDGSTLTLDFTTGVLDSRLTFTRSTTATYINSSGYVATAAINAARFDYDPTTLAARGLLIEGSAANLLNWSASFATSGGVSNNWADTSITRTTGQADPANGTTAIRFAASAANATVISSAAIGTSAQRTFSIWLRRVTGTGNIQFTTSNGTTWTTQAITSSWVRYTFPATTEAQQVGIRIVTSGDVIEMWGAQLEAGSGASSYIPTGASTATRNADSCIMTGTDFSGWFTTAGTFLVEHQLTNAFGTADRVQVGLGQYASGTSAFAFFRTNATTVGAAVWGSGGTGYQEGTTSVSARTPIRSGMTLDFTGSTRSLRAFANGTTGASLVSTTGTISVDRMFLGSNGSGTSSTRDYQNGHIRSLKFWPSVLPNATLQSLTT